MTRGDVGRLLGGRTRDAAVGLQARRKWGAVGVLRGGGTRGDVGVLRGGCLHKECCRGWAALGCIGELHVMRMRTTPPSWDVLDDGRVRSAVGVLRGDRT